MPPKMDKNKQKVVEDKTFGMKNKKGKKQQEFVKQVTAAVANKKNNEDRKKEAEMLARKEKQKDKADKEAMINELFKPVIQQKVNQGEDPKSVVCAFFKKGQCTKGDKCKFSHDLAVERKSAKRDIYSDVRDGEDENDKMENWDQSKLESVVESKHGKEKSRPQTAIVCKFFLEALEKQLYGWFWVCPNGGDQCMYRHALPPGYVLKKDKKKDEEEEKISIEELVERERAALGSNTTKVTLETFMEWKKRKIEEKKKALDEEMSKKKKTFKDGNKGHSLRGRELFEFNPDLVAMDDDEAGDASTYVREHREEETQPSGEENAPQPLYDLHAGDGDDEGEAAGTGDGDEEEEEEDTEAEPVDAALFEEEDFGDEDD